MMSGGFYVLPARAAMQSDNYIIYENVMHSFDGPVISNVSHSVNVTQVTVAWDTDVAADSFVVYSTDSGFATSREQGSSAKNSTAHSVTLTGLDESTTYYYRVRSERVNGGITTDYTSRSFTTTAEPVVTPPTPSGGGGLLIIDKTDKVPPVITNVAVSGITAGSVSVTWDTDESATSFVQYGPDTDYGSTYGDWATGTAHQVILRNLQAGYAYHFRAVSSDSWGNIGYSDDRLFTTEQGIVTPEEAPTSTPPAEATTSETTIIEQINNFLNRLFPQVSLNQLGPNPLTTVESLADITGLINAPIFQGEPAVDAGATDATITWTSDIESNSLVAISPDDAYDPGATEPYEQVTGDFENYTTEHEVKIFNLSPDTLYHFQLRGQANLGPMSRSRDFTFRTITEELSITSFFTQIVDTQTATFRWITNKDADSAIRFAPYHGNVLAIDQSKTIKDNTQSIIHEITVKEFEGGLFYGVELISADSDGNIASQELPRFSTSENDLPPEITQVKADSTVFLDRSNKIQTIISWTTNEPATSRVYYEEGVQAGNAELTESTELNSNYTKDHVMVITKFRPGIVYSFRVESIDSGGNVSLSELHTFMTAKQKESIIQVILGVLEETFGWVNKLRG